MKEVTVFLLQGGMKKVKSHTDITLAMVKAEFPYHNVSISPSTSGYRPIPPLWNKSKRSRAAYRREYGYVADEDWKRASQDDYLIHSGDFVSAARKIGAPEEASLPKKSSLKKEGWFTIIFIVAVLCRIVWQLFHDK